MTATSQPLLASPQFGLTVSINYDDATLKSTGFTIVLATQLKATIGWFYTDAGNRISGNISLNTPPGTYNAPYVVTGTSHVDRHGEAIVSWPFAPYGISITA